MMIYAVFLQIVTNTQKAAASTTAVVDTVGQAAMAAAAAPKEDTLSLMELIMKGGIIMIPIGILSLLTLYFFFERLIALRQASKLDANFMNSIKDYIHNGNIDSAKALCRNSKSPAARVVEKGVMRIGKPIREIEDAMSNVGTLELSKMEKNISALSLIGRIAPILGFVGTIMGVIKIFYDISLTDNISIGVISAGLYQKMITSASGLVVGLLAFIAYYIINLFIDKIVHQMELASVQFIDILQEPAKHR